MRPSSLPAPQIWDISPPVTAQSPVFPGDTAYQQHWVAELSPQCPVNVSAITASPHVGAHADAPLHYAPGAAGIGAVPLAPYIGHCRVLHLLAPGPVVTLEALLERHDALLGRRPDLSPAWPARLLVRTYAQQPQDRFDHALSGMAPQALDFLADQGVALIGTDSASIDPAASKTLDAHQVLRQRDLRVLENLWLDEVEEGDYELIALPLRWMEADASPVRAILRPWPLD